MKKSLFLLPLAFSFYTCKEIAPIIPPLTPPSGDRNILVEEFTGVECVNCPDGSAKIQDLIAFYGDRLVAVSIHAGYFAEPYPNNLYDFRTQDGTQLQTFLGEPDGYPSAVINRKLFPTEQFLQVGKDKWAGYIQAEAASPPIISVALTHTYDPATRTLEATVNLVPSEDISGDTHLSLLITESGIVDLQQTPAGFVPDYVHKHVLRDVLTNYDGDPIQESLTTGAVIQKTFSYTLPDNWNANNCHLVAFVSRAGASKEVLQVTEKKVVE